MTKRLLKKLLKGLIGGVLLAVAVSIITAATATTSFSYVVTDLGQLDVYGINDVGQIVGDDYIESEMVTHAVMWDNGTITDLGILGSKANGAYYSIARGINNKGQIVGYSDIKSGVQHAFLWQNGVMTDLNTLGGTRSYAYGINNAGQIVGSSDTDSDRHAFKWNDGTIQQRVSITKVRL